MPHSTRLEEMMRMLEAVQDHVERIHSHLLENHVHLSDIGEWRDEVDLELEEMTQCVVGLEWVPMSERYLRLTEANLEINRINQAVLRHHYLN